MKNENKSGISECGPIRSTEPRTAEGLPVLRRRPVRQEPAPPSPARHPSGALRVRCQGLLGEGSDSGLPRVSTPSGTVSRFYSPEILSDFCPLCPPFQTRLRDAQERRGTGEGLRLSSGPSSVWVSTHDKTLDCNIQDI